MNITTPTPSISSILAQVAVMLEVSSSSLGMSRTDRQAGAELDRAKNAEHGTSRAQIARLTPAGADMVKAINRTSADMRNAANAMTMPFHSMRILPNSMIERWLKTYKDIKDKHTAQVDAFIADAPQLIADAEVNLQNFTIAPPTEEEIREAFSLEFKLHQIPDTSTFHASGVGQAMHAEMSRHFEKAAEAAYHHAQQDTMQRIAKPLTKLIERLAAYETKLADHANGKENRGGKMFDSTIEDVQDIAAMVRSFNMTGDPLMDSLATKLDDFMGCDIDDLKSDAGLRKHLTKSAEDILADLADLI